MRQGTAIARISSTRISSRARTQSIPALVNSDQDERTDSPSSMADPKQNDGSSSDDDDGKGKSRRELPTGAVATLKAWLLSPEHFTHPYPTPQDQIMLMQKTGIDKKQLKNWFTNARRRIWKPMLKKQLEQGKLTPTGVGGGGVAGPGLMVTSVPGPLAPTELTTPELQVHYQQAVQQQQPQPVRYFISIQIATPHTFFKSHKIQHSFVTTVRPIWCSCVYASSRSSHGPKSCAILSASV